LVTVLVAYATAHGSTKGIAQAIARQMSTAGVLVDLRAADDVGDVRAYDAVVLGSAVHNGGWLTPASELLAQLGREPRRPLWLFSVCTVGETTSFLGPRLSRLARRARKLPPGVASSGAPHRFFAGVIERSHWNALGRLFFLATGGRYGDHRDWADIEQWTTGIIAGLHPNDRA
jgi:menaquinone-dependent protoporphyrinogen oxidase